MKLSTFNSLLVVRVRPWTVRDFGGINWNRDGLILLDVLQILTIVFVAPVA